MLFPIRGPHCGINRWVDRGVDQCVVFAILWLLFRDLHDFDKEGREVILTSTGHRTEDEALTTILKVRHPHINANLLMRNLSPDSIRTEQIPFTRLGPQQEQIGNCIIFETAHDLREIPTHMDPVYPFDGSLRTMI